MLAVSGGLSILFIFVNAVWLLRSADRARKESTVSPFLWQFAKLPPLNLRTRLVSRFFSREAACAAAVVFLRNCYQLVSRKRPLCDFGAALYSH